MWPKTWLVIKFILEHKKMQSIECREVWNCWHMANIILNTSWKLMISIQSIVCG